MTKTDPKTLAVSLLYLEELFNKSNATRHNEIATVKKELLEQVQIMIEEFDITPLLPILEEPKQGLKGDKGIKGDTGKPGPKGKDGIKGDTGKQGIQGETGIQGKDGIQGDTGEQGIQGETGEQGIQGETGIQGVKGNAGLDGTNGKDGIKGDTGEQGEAGANGKDGLNGTNGKDGKKGLDGKDGLNGKDGLDGKDGLNGKDGKDGIAAEAPDIQPHLDKVTKDFNNWRENVNKSLQSMGGGGSYRILDNADVKYSKVSQMNNNDILVWDETINKFTSLNITDVINTIRLELDVQFDKLIEEVTVNGVSYTYIGESEPGSNANEAKWRIKRIAEYASGLTEILWAEDTETFDKIWNERTTFTYNV
jgi:hypothetical protein